MKTLIFQGHSDDTFACTGPGIDVDRDNCASGAPIWMRVQAGKADALLVCGHYATGPAAGWLIGISPADWPDHHERHIPAWPMRFEQSRREYSPQLVIEAPDDVVVTLVDVKGRKLPRTEQEKADLVAELRAEVEKLKTDLNHHERQWAELGRTANRMKNR